MSKINVDFTVIKKSVFTAEVEIDDVIANNTLEKSSSGITKKYSNKVKMIINKAKCISS